VLRVSSALSDALSEAEKGKGETVVVLENADISEVENAPTNGKFANRAFRSERGRRKTHEEKRGLGKDREILRDSGAL